jgi:hypothetical protein
MSPSNIKSNKFTFSGHESFQCRHLWLKKGYDFVNKNKSFNDEDAVVSLGVGKNMVNSIKYWMKAFNIISNNDNLTDFAHKLLSDDGFDPFIEDEATLWLLHYQLVKNRFATIYSLIFNELRREKIEFSRDNFVAFVRRKAEQEKSFIFNEKTLNEDFSVFIKMYLRSDVQNKDKEDSFSGLLTELDLLKCYNKGKEEIFIIENTERTELPAEVVLYSILDDKTFDSSVSFSSLEMNTDSIGSIFAINRPGLQSKIEIITQKNEYIIYNDHAGVKELQFKVKPLAVSILDNYYAN